MAENLMLEGGERFRALFENAPDIIYVHDLSGKILQTNRAFSSVTGYSADSVIGKSFFSLISPEYRYAAEQMVLEQIGGGKPQAHNLSIRAANGQNILFEVKAELLFENGAPFGIQAFAREVSQANRESAVAGETGRELLKKTNELARFSRHLQLLHRLSTTNYEQLPDLLNDYLAAGCEIFEVPHGVVTRLQDGLPEIRASHGGVINLDESVFTRIVEDRRTIVSPDGPNSSFIGTPMFVNEEVVGTIAFWSKEGQAPPAPHPQGREIIELMAKSIGIAINQRQLTTQLAHQAQHDALTGLPNRLLLSTRLDRAILRANQNGSLLAVLFIDLDRFKEINDTLGHRIGDELLKDVAGKLQALLKPGDTLARMGGDEFTAILAGAGTMENAVDAAREMLAVVQTPCRVERYELFVTASMGLSFYPKDGQDAATLLRNADSAMYVAKNRGKNDVRCFTAEGSAMALERLELENYLRRALDHGELRIYYQPQVKLDGKLAGLEVLLLWEHPKLGRVSPAQFIPIAEESGMILVIGAWVLRQACEQAARWQQDGYDPVRIAVNVSALQFGQGNFVQTVADILAETKLSPGCLELELTESLVMRDVDQSIRRMSELRKLGVRITIDDFGTGYSSLSYLRRLPADALKIDQSFLQEIELGPATLPLIQTIVILAHYMGLSVTAEGVETQKQLELIQQAGCDEAQGHFFGAAVESSAVGKLLARTGRIC